jgi:hypothetical protein
MINSAARSQLSGKKWYRNISAGNPLYSEMELISTSLISSPVSSVTFDVTGLGSSYKHLHFRITGRDTNSSDQAIGLRFNGDTGSNYTFHQIYANGSTISSNGFGTGTFNYAGLGLMPGASYTSNSFGAVIIDILDFASTTKNKTCRANLAWLSTSANNLNFRSSAWLSTSAITSVNVFATGTSFAIGSRISIYGIKG